jgi:hypothetical protein
MRIDWMKGGARLASVAFLCAVGVASAKLPPPTPEEQEAAQARKQKQEAQLEQEKKQLEKAQDRVAQYYKRTKGGSASGGAPDGAGRIADHNMPKTTKELPHSAGPHGGKTPSAEAHSAPAK